MTTSRPRTLGEAIAQAQAKQFGPEHPLAAILRTWHTASSRRARLAQLNTTIQWRCDHALSMPENKGPESVEAHLKQLINYYRLPFAYHANTPMRDRAGWPDWTLIGAAGRGTLFAELKSEKGRFSDAQIDVMCKLAAAGENVTWFSPVDVLTGRMRKTVKWLAGRSDDETYPIGHGAELVIKQH